MSEAERLAFHVIAAHKNVMAIANSREVNLDDHVHDHFGPCGLRDHSPADLSYDEDELEAALEEAEADL